MTQKRSKKAALLISGFIGLSAFALFIIQEIKVNGFEGALTRLVDTRTKGEYKLVIGSTDFDLLNLMYELTDLAIVRTGASAHPGGVQSINIPSIEAKLGSFFSFFSSPRITFTDVVVTEPTVVVDSRVREQNKVTIGQALVTVFPVVESVLSHFEIRSLKIQHANLTVEQPGDHPIHLRLIDLLVEDWHGPDLDDDGEIQLNVGPQEVLLSQASFAFRGMEYKYSEHYLTFKDFTFHSLDSATASQIDVAGKSVLIRNLDYQELYDNQRYKLDKIEITEPRFSGALRARSNTGANQEIHLPLAEILKQTFGEIQLDTASIDNAVFQMTLAVDQDSIKANVSQVNIDLHDLAVITDSSDIQFGELAMDLSETEISVNDNVKLICSSMLFERNEDIIISNIRLTDVLNNETFAACERIGFKNFHLFEFLIGRDLKADSIAIKNADVTLTPAFLDLFPDFSGRTPRRRPTVVAIGELSLQDVNLSYSNSMLRLALNDVSTRVNTIRDLSWNALLKKLETIDLRSVSYEHKALKLRTRIDGVHLTPVSAAVRQGELSYGSLTMTATDLIAARRVPYSPGSDPTRWKSIEVGSLVVEGSMPENQNPMEIDNLVIRDLVSNLAFHEKTVALTAKDLHARDVNTAGYSSFGNMSGRIYKVGVSTPSGSATADSVLLDTNGASDFFNVRINAGGRTNVIPYAKATGLVWRTNEKLLRHFFASGVRLREGGVPSLTADSLRLNGITLTRNFEPLVDTVVLYDPLFSAGTTTKTFSDNPFANAVSAFTLHGGRIDIGNQRLTLEGITAGRLGPDFKLASNRVIFDAFQHHIILDSVTVEDGNMLVEGLTMDPAPDPENTYETDIIAASSKGIRIRGLIVDSLVQNQKIIADTLFVSGLTLDVRRDRRLPDPDPMEKPFSFEELLSSSGLDAKAIHLRDGFIRYTETSGESGEEGTIAFHDLNANIGKEGGKPGYSFTANARLYDQAPVHINYQYIDDSSFRIKASVGSLNLTALNQVLTPLQGMALKSGYLEEFQFEAVATRDTASGHALITYNDLRMALLKRSADPDKKNLGNEIITFLANGILRHKRYRATAPILETRAHEKSMFNYWKRIAANGALQVIRKGKTRKR